MKTWVFAAAIAVAPSASLAAGCQETFTALLDMLVDDGAIEEAPTALVRARTDNWCGVRALRVPLETGQILAIEDFAWRGVDMDRFVSAGLPPTALDVSAKGVRFARATGDATTDALLLEMLAGTGMDVSFSGEWEKATRSLAVHNLTLSKDDGDRISLSAAIDNIDLTSTATIQMSAGGWSASKMGISAQIGDVFGRYAQRATNVDAEVAEASLAELPDEVMARASKDALVRFIDSDRLGLLTVTASSDPGFSALRLAPLFMAGGSLDPAQLWNGVVFDIGFVPR